MVNSTTMDYPAHDLFPDIPNKRRRTESRIPPGWLDCPNLGEWIVCLLPSKTPLDATFDHEIPIEQRYSFDHLTNLVPRKLGLVIDLTNTTRYYSVRELKRRFEGVDYVNIPCVGHGSVPDNESVNRFVYEVSQFEKSCKKGKYILVHCTHGFNRTGYMIVHYLMRTLPLSVTQAVEIFAGARPPGIYKPEYIDALYAFYHEEKPDMICYPSVPEWKEFSGHEFFPAGTPMQADVYYDVVKSYGDSVPRRQQEELRLLCNQLLGLGNRSSGFPGSHPVSVNRENMKLLRRQYYLATWKADGTRFMMLITRDGCYLIDRMFEFRRVQMRFPTRDNGDKTHHMTLLDGEMVIDTIPDSGKQEQRFLVYDMMALNGDSIVKLPFSERWNMVETEVIQPRNLERMNIDQSGKPYYRYELEPFRVRRKAFWLLSTVPKILSEFIPKLSHEADGLIFQGREDPYVPRAHQGLLKWKYPRMNSVDFLFRVDKDRHQLYLYDGRRKRLVLSEINAVVFEDGSDPRSYSGKIIECAWKSEQEAWAFLRVRDDKDNPNELNTCRNVITSIRDNVTEEILLGDIMDTIRLPMYADRSKT